MKKNSPFKKINTGLLIRIDDISSHMNWNLMNKCEELFNKHNIKPLLGVIPNNEDEEILKYEKKENFWEQVRIWQNKGWEISMHGYNHVYDTETNKKDFFGYGGRSEFYGHSFENQMNKILRGKKIFNNEGVKVKSFFAPNHTYDLNTFKALKENNLMNVIDGYGFFPYKEFEINFIPQLFYKEIMLPYGIQSTQVHLNYMNDNSFLRFEKFIIKNKSRILEFEEVLNSLDNGIISKFTRAATEKTLKLLRM
jgi:predicted deacetylase